MERLTKYKLSTPCNIILLSIIIKERSKSYDYLELTNKFLDKSETIEPYRKLLGNVFIT